MTTPPDITPFEELVHRLDPDSRLLRAWALTGGISAQMTALEIEWSDRSRTKIVVRQHGEAELQDNPQVAANESRLLERLRTAGLPVPTVYWFDPSGQIFPTPYIVIDYIEGETEFSPANLPDYIRQFATQLSRIHRIAGSKVSFLPALSHYYHHSFRQRPARVDESLGEGRIREVLEKVWPFPRRNPSVLLHGDFWPGNILWRGGQIVGIIDWEDAQRGDPLADLAISRLDMLWAFGIDAMEQFTQIYLSLAQINPANLPYWDLCAALRPAFVIATWADEAHVTEQQMRDGHKWFVAQAFEKLSIKL